ncbi:hypothetical protein [Brevundimonas sp.]|uniref:hypothetical protein n=1 Tax=Brevundimonas sp. TaxID=1871086 RepID=UPI003784938F
MKLWLLTMVAVGLSATGAQAQQSFRMNDGRTLTIARTISGCQPLVATETTAATVTLKADCRVPFENGGQPDTDGSVTLVVFTAATPTTPTSFANNVAAHWNPDFPSLPADQKANFVTQTTKASAAGPLALRCAHRDNIAALNGEAICALDTPTLTMAIAGLSTMASTADNIVDAALTGVTIR